MSIPVTSIGATISIAASAEIGGARPSEFTALPMVYSFPEVSFTPSIIDTTSYDNAQYKSSVAGLAESSGVQTIEAFYSAELTETWSECCDAYREGRNVWLRVTIPAVKKAYYIPVVPVEPVMPALPLNDAVRQKLMFTICGDIESEDVAE